MDISEPVEAYLASQPEPKQADLRLLHARILTEFPRAGCGSPTARTRTARSWPTPTSATACYTISYADGSSREFYRIGLSANTTGISVYVLGLDDKTYLART